MPRNSGSLLKACCFAVALVRPTRPGRLASSFLTSLAAARVDEGLAAGWLVRAGDGRLCVAAEQPTRQHLLLAMQERELSLAGYDVVIVGNNDPYRAAVGSHKQRRRPFRGGCASPLVLESHHPPAQLACLHGCHLCV